MSHHELVETFVAFFHIASDVISRARDTTMLMDLVKNAIQTLCSAGLQPQLQSSVDVLVQTLEKRCSMRMALSVCMRMHMLCAATRI